MRETGIYGRGRAFVFFSDDPTAAGAACFLCGRSAEDVTIAQAHARSVRVPVCRACVGPAPQLEHELAALACRVFPSSTTRETYPKPPRELAPRRPRADGPGLPSRALGCREPDPEAWCPECGAELGGVDPCLCVVAAAVGDYLEANARARARKAARALRAERRAEAAGEAKARPRGA